MLELYLIATADPDGRKRALLIGGGIANFTDVAATFNGIIRALKEREKLKASRMHIYVRRGGPNYQSGRANEGPKPATRGGVNESQSKFLRNSNRRPMSQNHPSPQAF